jgi:GNAT superfamily N-acetyltransferase
MARLEILLFTDEHLDPAASLLAARHERHRAAEPLLPDVSDFRSQVERELRREGAAGAVAMRGGRAIGYVVGAPAGDGRAEVGLAGHATEEPEVARDLYAHLAQAWSDAGLTRHAVYVPASDAELIDAWFRLAFGLQFCFAVQEVTPRPPVDSDVVIRRGRPRDLEMSAAFERSLWEHQVLSPSFSGMAIPPLANFVDDWGDTWSNPSFAHFVAERDGRPVGQALTYVRPTGDLRIPDGAVDLAQVETLPEERGTGVGRAMWAHVMNWSHEQGYRAMTTDWRSVNLLASRFWTHRGFRPTFLRLYRSIP